MFNVGQIVKLHTNDEWNGLCGIIQEIRDDKYEIFCVPIPYFTYYCDVNNSEQILELVE